MEACRMRHQLGHSPHLTVERDCTHRDHETNEQMCVDIFRSYETPILVLDEKNNIVFADVRKYSTMTTRHQLQLAHFRPEYVLPEKRERVTYEFCLKHTQDGANGPLYQPLYKAKDNPYDPWHIVSKG